MSFSSPLATPTSDLKIAYSVDAASGSLVVEWPLSPYNDLSLIAGTPRLVQDVVRWLLTPVGSNPLDPTFGNPLFSLLGRPSGDLTDVFFSMVKQAEGDFLARQQQAAAQGFLSLDEQVDSFSDPTITFGDGNLTPFGSASVSFTIYTRSGVASQALVPFSLTVGI